MRKLALIALLLAGCSKPAPPEENAGRGFLPREVDEAATLIAKYVERRDEIRAARDGLIRAGRTRNIEEYARMEEREAEKIKLLLEKLTERRFAPAIEELGLFGIDYGG